MCREMFEASPHTCWVISPANLYHPLKLWARQHFECRLCFVQIVSIRTLTVTCKSRLYHHPNGCRVLRVHLDPTPLRDSRCTFLIAEARLRIDPLGCFPEFSRCSLSHC